MSILTAMSTGVSGLNAESEALGVIGNNLANSNTVGFKQSRAVFDNVLELAVGTEGAIGAGRTHGDRPADLQRRSAHQHRAADRRRALRGRLLRGQRERGRCRTGTSTPGPVRHRSTRTARWSTPTGSRSRATGSIPNGTFGATLQPLTVNTAALAPKPTTAMNVTANLDANADAAGRSVGSAEPRADEQLLDEHAHLRLAREPAHRQPVLHEHGQRYVDLPRAGQRLRGPGRNGGPEQRNCDRHVDASTPPARLQTNTPTAGGTRQLRRRERESAADVELRHTDRRRRNGPRRNNRLRLAQQRRERRARTDTPRARSRASRSTRTAS